MNWIKNTISKLNRTKATKIAVAFLTILSITAWQFWPVAQQEPVDFQDDIFGAVACTIAKLDTVSTVEYNTGTGTVTYSHTVSTGASVLIVGVSMSSSGGGASLPSGVTFNGDALTLATSLDTNTRASSLWYRINPDITTANVVITPAHSNDKGVTSAAINFSGTDTTDPIGNVNTAGQSAGSFTSSTVSVTSTSASNWVIDYLGLEDPSSNVNMVPGADQSEQADLFSGTNKNVHGGMSTEIGTGSRTMSWSWATPSGATRHVAAEIIAATNCPDPVTEKPRRAIIDGAYFKIEDQLLIDKIFV